MKEDQKKALYESVMKTVAQEVKKALNESAGDGWNLDDVKELSSAFDEIEEFIYEVRNCVRGAYTNCNTYEELASRIRDIIGSLEYAADILEGMEEPEPEDEDEEEYIEDED